MAVKFRNAQVPLEKGRFKCSLLVHLFLPTFHCPLFRGQTSKQMNFRAGHSQYDHDTQRESGCELVASDCWPSSELQSQGRLSCLVQPLAVSRTVGNTRHHIIQLFLGTTWNKLLQHSGTVHQLQSFPTDLSENSDRPLALWVITSAANEDSHS